MTEGVPRIDPRGVRLFLAICRAGSISGAARAENLSQPSVSVAIAHLEHRLKTRLFERHRSGIRLTPAGIALQRRAEAMESLLEAAQREVHLIDAGIEGPLLVGGTPGALATVIPRVVASLKLDYPRFEMRVLERSDEALMGLLRDQRIDLAVITAGMEDRPVQFEELVLVSDAFALVVGSAHDGLPDQISLHDLAGMRWVLPEIAGAFRRQIDALFVSAEVPTPGNIIRCDTLLTTKEIVRQTDYVTILPGGVVAPEASQGILRSITIKEAMVERKVGLLRLKERAPTSLASAFVDHAQRIAYP